MMKYSQIIRNFSSLLEARAFYHESGWVVADKARGSYIMIKRLANTKVGEVIINREGVRNVVADEIITSD